MKLIIEVKVNFAKIGVHSEEKGKSRGRLNRPMNQLKLFFLYIVFALAAPLIAQNPDPTILHGFKLWQFRDAVIAEMGQPDDTIEREGTKYELYRLHEDGYILFEYLDSMPHNIASIQATGWLPDIVYLEEIRIGMPQEKLESILGLPSRTDKIRKPVKKSLLLYNDIPVSFEILDGRVYSMRIGVSEKLMGNAEHEPDPWLALTQAVQSKEPETIIDRLRPDVEFYRGEQLYTIDRSYVNFLSSPAPEFMEALIGDENSLLAAINESEPESEMRVIMGMGVGFVYKFYKGSIVREVVLFPYDGEYRVYEMLFYETAPESPPPPPTNPANMDKESEEAAP